MAQNDQSMAAAGIRRSKAEPVNEAERRALYKKREPIYPKLVHGKFRLAKWIFTVIALGVYYLIPFLRYPRGGGAPDQAVLVDFTGQRFYFFWIEIWPQEIYFVSGLLIMAALSLFLVTALFGRVWCGYACPQTVWTDLFIAVERLFEGDRNKRIKLDRAPMSFNKAWRKTGKHAVWLLIAGATGGAWILYFHDAFDIIESFLTGQAPVTAYIFFALLTFTTYTLAGTMREQVCTYMCPWPRIQAAMTDLEALNVAYRVDRGEPRGAHKKGDSWEGRGDCIDCKACVAACPMGIDIRNGSQLECIQCALCIDACDDIMKKVGLPTGLIAYETDENIVRRQKGEKPRYRLIRPRVVFYAVALALVSVIMLYALSSRSVVELDVSRDRNPNFVRLADGSIRNSYTLTVINKTHEPQTYLINVDSEVPLQTRLLNGAEGEDIGVELGPDSTRDFRVFLTLPADYITRSGERLTFTVTSQDGNEARADAVLQTGRR